MPMASGSTKTFPTTSAQGLHGTREAPVLLLATPFSAGQVAELLRLALPPPVPQEAASNSGRLR